MQTTLLAAALIGGSISALGPRVASAQAAQAPPSAPERNSFYLLLGNDTLISERVTRTPAELRGEFVDRMRGGRMAYVATLAPDASITRLATQYFRGATDTVGETATFDVSGDAVVARMGTAGPATIPSVGGALPMINPSVAFLEQLVLRARATRNGAKALVPLFILGSPQPLPAMVTFLGTDSVTLDYAGVSMRVAISPTGRILGGGAPAQRVSFVRGPAVDGALTNERRDYTAPGDAPYTAEDVVVRTPAGIRLTGTLTLPKARATGRASGRASGRAPAVVTITGSGPEDRDEQSAALPLYRPFREIADTLGRRGIAVLRLDDRGVGGSDLGTSTVTSADFADDIRAAVAYLRSRAEIDGARIGIIGHSEGGVIAPMVAESDAAVRALVLMAAPASPGRDVLRSQQHYMIDTVMQLTGARRDTALAQSRRAVDSLAAASAWMQWYITHDPSATARRVRTPVLILQGETDHQVPSSEAEKLAAAFRGAGNPRVDVRMFPETNHLFVADKVGGFSYEKLPSLAVRKDVLGAIADWLSAQLP